MHGESSQAAGNRVVHDPQRQRYDLVTDDDQLAGFLAYQDTGQLIVLTHTEVDPRFEGQGLGGELVRQVLDGIRSRGIPVLPPCPFVQQWMKGRPDYHDLDYRWPESKVTD